MQRTWESSSFMAKYEAIGIAFSFSSLLLYYNIIIKYGTWHFCYWLLLLKKKWSPPLQFPLQSTIF